MPTKKKINNCGWTYDGKPVNSIEDMPPNVLGFIYRIDVPSTGRYYYGRKTVSSKKKRKLTAKEKLLPENKKKTFIYEVKETSGWKTYCGSNSTLKAEVKEGQEVNKTIIKYCFTKAQMTYEETSAIICSGALLDPLAYNDWVSCRTYKKYLINND